MDSGFDSPDTSITVVTTPPQVAVVLLITERDILPPFRDPQDLLTLLNGVRVHRKQFACSESVFVLNCDTKV